MVKGWLVLAEDSSVYRELEHQLMRYGRKVALCGYGRVRRPLRMSHDGGEFGRKGQHVLFVNSISDRAMRILLRRSNIPDQNAIPLDGVRSAELDIGPEGRVEFDKIPNITFSEFAETLPREEVIVEFSSLPHLSLFKYNEREYKKLSARLAAPSDSGVVQIFPPEEKVVVEI